MVVLGGGLFLMSEVPLYPTQRAGRAATAVEEACEDQVLDGPASGKKGSKDRK